MGLPGATGGAGGAEGAASFFAAFGFAAGAGAVVPAAAAVASDPHSALRKSFHLMSLAVPASRAALYFALHSFMVSACEGPVAAVIEIKLSPMDRTTNRAVMLNSPRVIAPIAT